MNNNSNEKLVSIIIPVYNVADYLKDCFDSILSQDYQNFEVILVDDGSKDDSGEICDEYAKKDTRFIVIHKSNEGVSIARNTALSNSKGEYITFIDPGDWVEKNYLSSLVQHLEKNNTDCACCTFFHISPEKCESVIPQDCVKKSADAMSLMMKEHWYTTVVWNKIFRRESIMKNGDFIFFQKGRTVGEDEKWLVEVLIDNNCSVCFFGKPLYYWRIREKSALHSVERNGTRQMLDEVCTKEELWKRFSKDKNSEIYKLAAKSLYEKTFVVCKYAYSFTEYNVIKNLYPKLKYGRKLWLKEHLKNFGCYSTLRRIYWEIKIFLKAF